MSLKYVVLTLVNREPMTGYEIVKIFRGSVGYFWHASHQQVYRELGQLTEAGLVRFTEMMQTDKPDKKVYRISARGQCALVEWVSKPLTRSGTKDALLVKLLSVQSVGAAVLLRQLSAEAERMHGLLDTYRGIETAHYQPAARRSLSNIDRVLYVALRRGILDAEAQLTWLREAMDEFAAMPEESSKRPLRMVDR